jgi:hypothetical protein
MPSTFPPSTETTVTGLPVEQAAVMISRKYRILNRFFIIQDIEDVSSQLD